MKKGLILVLILVLALSLFATSFAASALEVKEIENSEKVIVNVGNNNGGIETLSAPIRIIDW